MKKMERRKCRRYQMNYPIIVSSRRNRMPAETEYGYAWITSARSS